VKPAKPVTEITAAAVADDPVNETVMEVGVDLKLLDNAMMAAEVEESTTAGKVPATLDHRMDTPLLSVTAADKVKDAGWGLKGFVKPGMANAIAALAGNALLAFNEMVRTDPLSTAEPDGAIAIGAVNATATGCGARTKPEPVSVMKILPSFATSLAGVSMTLITTPEAPLTTLLNVMTTGDALTVSVMGGTTTPENRSSAVVPPLDAKVDIVPGTAAEEKLGVVNPVTTHETPALRTAEVGS
jgi:hypothetical protein